MSDRSSAGPGSWTGDSPSPDSTTHGSASPTPTAEPFSSDDGPEFPSTTMCAFCAPDEACALHQSTYWPEAFPASPSPSSDVEPPRATTDGSGLTLSEPFAYYDRDTSSWKTSQVSLLPEWETFSGGWPPAGMTRNGNAYQLLQQAPLTDVTGSSLWPTPVAHDDGKTPEAHLAMKERMPGGPRRTITSLTVMVKAVARGWPTPSATDWKGSSRLGQRRGQLSEAAALGGQLNPVWVEWLMGCPGGWTDSALSETASSLKSRSGSESGFLRLKQ